MKKTLLILSSIVGLTSVAQVEIEPFAPSVPGTYIGDFSSMSAGSDIPTVSTYTEEGNTGGANNDWTVDDGSVIANFAGGIGNWAAGRCDFGQTLTLVTPEMNFGTNTQNPTLSFRYIIDNGVLVSLPGGFTSLNMEVMYKESSGGSWNSLATYTTVDNTWHDITLDLSGASSYATYYLGFRIYGAVNGSLVSWGYMGLDEIVVTGESGGCAPSAATISPTACYNYTSPSGLYTWTSSGTYNDTIPNMAGCDSVITVNLTINSADNSVSLAGMTLTAGATSATYQWLDCDNSFAVISGATNQSFTPSSDGNYAVAVTQNGCQDTSACTAVIFEGLTENGLAEVYVFPNPTQGELQVYLGSGSGSCMVRITDVQGRMVQEVPFSNQGLNTILLTGDRGVYFVEVLKDGERKVIRVIKN